MDCHMMEMENNDRKHKLLIISRLTKEMGVRYGSWYYYLSLTLS